MQVDEAICKIRTSDILVIELSLLPLFTVIHEKVYIFFYFLLPLATLMLSLTCFQEDKSEVMTPQGCSQDPGLSHHLKMRLLVLPVIKYNFMH